MRKLSEEGSMRSEPPCDCSSAAEGLPESPSSFIPALTACTPERMQTFRFLYLAGFAAREREREAKPVKLKKVAFSHFFDAPGRGFTASASFFKLDV